MTGRLRISGGELRGRLVRTQESVELRPTTERVRESVFSALQGRGLLEGARVLDLFAGSGILGFEALSRGASSVDFVEADRRRSIMLKDNAASLGLEHRVLVSNGPVEKLKKLLPSRCYSLIFADPPYEEQTFLAVATLVLESGYLEAGGVLVFEGRKGTSDADQEKLLALVGRCLGSEQEWWKREFGDTEVIIVMPS
jgi:16S rRNA (guanine966-N2)-methyltransferase